MPTHAQDISAAREAQKKLAERLRNKPKATVKDISLVIWAKRLNLDFSWNLVKTTKLYRDHGVEYCLLLEVIQ